MKKLLLATSATVALAAVPAIADTLEIEPDAIQYDFEKKTDVHGITCNLMMMVVQPGVPVVNFRFIQALSKNSPRALFLGFSLDAGNVPFVNGKPTGLTPIPSLITVPPLPEWVLSQLVHAPACRFAARGDHVQSERRELQSCFAPQ